MIVLRVLFSQKNRLGGTASTSRTRIGKRPLRALDNIILVRVSRKVCVDFDPWSIIIVA
jgi:hypothetical protein